MIKKIFILFLFCLILISCDKEVSVSPTAAEISTGFMFIDSYPQRAQIYLNGRIMGRTTPDSLKWLEEGNYEVTLKKTFYKDTSFFVNIVEEAPSNLFIDYTNNPAMRGYIDCKTTPSDALIYINDSLIEAKTPYVIDGLWPGYYNINFQIEGFRKADLKVPVWSDEVSEAKVTMVDTTIWNDFTTANSNITSDDLMCVEIVNNNIIWMGTRGKGIDVFDGTNWTNYNKSNAGIPNDTVNCITYENDGSVWIGTRGGFTRYRDGVWYNYGMGVIEDIAIDDDGTKWIASSGGLISLNAANMRIYNSSNSGLPDDLVTEVVIDQNGDIWAGTFGYGVAKLSNNAWTIYTRTQNSLPGDRISSGALTLDGELWFGHSPWAQEVGGLSAYNFSNWRKILGLPSPLVEWIHVDDQNRKWVGTSLGLVMILLNGEMTVYNYDNTGLNLKHVKCIRQDSEGNLWIAAFGGGLITLKLEKI